LISRALISAENGIACIRAEEPSPSAAGPADRAAAWLALERLFGADRLPAGAEADLILCRDPLGKPFLQWSGRMAAWAASEPACRNLHISNTHDGGAHIVIAAHDPSLVGVGIDAVWLPRLRRPGKDRDYLLRFARQFMSAEEWQGFRAADEAEGDPVFGVRCSGFQGSRPPAADPDEGLRVRVAAHFSLMEAASKALGTGLKIGVGMGRETSLPKQSLGALRLHPDVRLLFEGKAVARLEALGAVRCEADVWCYSEFLVSAVALYRAGSEKSVTEAGGTAAKTEP
jgi:phosphopantetheinyl transferase (holo-ACP synthase)